MTKERRIAISMWTEIARMLENGEVFPITAVKTCFLDGTGIEWQNDCWFCQYMRRDYREELPSRREIHRAAEGCDGCPLFRNSYEKLAEGVCGCDGCFDTIYRSVSVLFNAESAWKVVELLGGKRDGH